MLSISNAEAVDVGDRILAAAASCVRDFGLERVTLAEIARRAGVSRPTVYRRWPDTRSILASLLTDRIVGAWRGVPSARDQRTGCRLSLVSGRRKSCRASETARVNTCLLEALQHFITRCTLRDCFLGLLEHGIPA